MLIINDFPLTDKNPQFFYDVNEFPYLFSVVDNFKIIKDELQVLLSQEVASKWFSTYPSYVRSHNDKSWQVFTLLFLGIKSRENAALCYQTSELMFSTPQILSCEFSVLKAHTHIMPHTGYSNTVLRCHLPLIVPEGNNCAIRVGDEIREWKEGELLIFDDSFEHEAWNKTEENRVVLMFDIPNPRWGLSAEEITRSSIENLKDKFLLSLASKEQWNEMYEKGEFPNLSFDL